jgi:hypothetical protein
MRMHCLKTRGDARLIVFLVPQTSWRFTRGGCLWRSRPGYTSRASHLCFWHLLLLPLLRCSSGKPSASICICSPHLVHKNHPKLSTLSSSCLCRTHGLFPSCLTVKWDLSLCFFYYYAGGLAHLRIRSRQEELQGEGKSMCTLFACEYARHGAPNLEGGNKKPCRSTQFFNMLAFAGGLLDSLSPSGAVLYRRHFRKNRMHDDPSARLWLAGMFPFHETSPCTPQGPLYTRMPQPSSNYMQ